MLMKTEIALFRHDHMIEDAKSENFCCFGQLLVHTAVRLAWLNVTRWVVMDKYYGSRAVSDDISKKPRVGEWGFYPLVRW
jgi:hypothetical protein